MCDVPSGIIIIIIIIIYFFIIICSRVKEGSSYVIVL
jgi:hypothetical protein